MNDTDDWFDVTRIDDGSYQIAEGRGVLQCNSFVLTAAEETLLIDTGLGIGDLPAVVDDLASGEVSVLLSHSHWDHIGGVHAFYDVRIHEAECPADGVLAIDSMTDQFDDRPAQFVDNWIATGRALPDSFDPDEYRIEPTDDVRPIAESERLSLGDAALELLAIPGHSPGQLAVLDHRTRICYAADVLEPEWELFAHLDHADVEVYRESVAQLYDYWQADAFDTLALTHGDPLVGDDLELLAEALDALEAVLDGDLQSDRITTKWGPAEEYETDRLRILTKL